MPSVSLQLILPAYLLIYYGVWLHGPGAALDEMECMGVQIRAARSEGHLGVMSKLTKPTVKPALTLFCVCGTPHCVLHELIHIRPYVRGYFMRILPV